MLSPAGIHLARPGRAGFTLIELMVVVAVLAILATIAAVTLVGYQRRARTAEIERFAAAVATAQAQIRPYAGYVSAGMCPRTMPAGSPRAFFDGCTGADQTAWRSLGVDLPNQTWHSFGLIAWEAPATCSEPAASEFSAITACSLPGGSDPSGWVFYAIGDQRNNGTVAQWATTHAMQGAFAQSNPHD